MNGAVWDFRSLRCWQRARALVRDVYQATETYPRAERFGLTSQTRRSCVSIAANLAEGCGRRGSAEFARFVDIATGSAFELECHLVLAKDLEFLDAQDEATLLVEVDEMKRMLIALAKGLSQRR